MKRLITLAGAFVTFAIAQTTISQTTEQPPVGPVCGTEAVMAKMPGERKKLMSASAVASQADELLLYINFNENGSAVRPGFIGNADTLTSTLVNQQRLLPAPQLSQEQKNEIVRRVGDEFSPFNIRITTDSAEFMAYPRQFKQMCLLTTTPAVAGFSSEKGGVAPFIGIGLRLPGDFAFVFSSQYGNDPLSVAAVVTHESAHLLGLGHQHIFSDTCGFLSEYHPGFGSGPLSFDLLMGEALTAGVNNWFAQSCPDPTFGLPQNDYDLINSQVVLRPDDFPDERAGNVVEENSITGVLERAGDVDLIRINFRDPGPVVVTSDNIDLKVSLLNPGGRVLGEFNDPTGTGVIVPSANGMRYLKVEAVSNENMSAQFMTGTYRISY